MFGVFYCALTETTRKTKKSCRWAVPYILRMYACARSWVQTVSAVVCLEVGRFLYKAFSRFLAERCCYKTVVYRSNSPVVAICTANLTFSNSTFCPHSAFIILFGSQNKQRLSPYTALIDWFLYEGFNFLKPSGQYMYHQCNIKQFYVLPTQCSYVLYGSENKQRLFPYTVLLLLLLLLFII